MSRVRSGRAVRLLCGAFLLMSCKGNDAGRPAPADQAPSAADTQLHVAAPEPPPSQPRADVFPVARFGLAGPPALPSPDARRANTLGYRKYQAKQLEGALALFEQAVALSPDYDLARYNAACVLALLGRTEQSIVQLRTVLLRDLPRSWLKLNADADLAGLRDTSSGKALLRETAELRNHWLEVAKPGVAAVAWVPHQVITDDRHAEAVHVRPEWFRVGVWVHNLARFLPLLPPVERALGGFVDLDDARGVVLSADLDPCLADLCPRMYAPKISYFAELVPRSAPQPYVLPMEYERPIFNFAAELGADGPRWSYHDSGWFEQSDGNAVRSSTGRPGAMRIDVGTHGTLLSHTSKGFVVHGDKITTPSGSVISRPRRLAGAELQVVATAEPSTALLLANWMGCDCQRGEDAILQHRVEILNLVEKRLTPWLAGPGNVAARVGSGGATYLQRDDELLRFTSLGEGASAEALPRGIVLTPERAEFMECCGL